MKKTMRSEDNVGVQVGGSLHAARLLGQTACKTG